METLGKGPRHAGWPREQGRKGPERGETIWDGEQGEGWAVTMVGIADAAEDDGGGEICCLLATGEEEEPKCSTPWVSYPIAVNSAAGNRNGVRSPLTPSFF